MKTPLKPGDPLREVLAAIEPLRLSLLQHPVYAAIRTVDDLRIFQQHHVFAVWDFMSLLKALQIRLTGCSVPWVPSQQPQAARLINEIVLGEESDEDGRGGHLSHFQLYLHAMEETQADTRCVQHLVSNVRAGMPLPQALEVSNVPLPARRFLKRTFSIIEGGSLPALASAFTLGREELIPDLFRKIVDDLARSFPEQLGVLRYYLERHIGLDEQEHGPMALELVRQICGGDASAWQVVRQTAEQALRARLELWNGIEQAIRSKTSSVD